MGTHRDTKIDASKQMIILKLCGNLSSVIRHSSWLQVRQVGLGVHFDKISRLAYYHIFQRLLFVINSNVVVAQLVVFSTLL